MVLPKYVRARAGTYHYQRDFPLRLRHLSGRKTFTYPLKLYINSASEVQLKKRAIEAEEAFDRAKLLIENSDPEALTASELDIAAADFLRKRGLKPGQFIRVLKDVDVSIAEEANQQQMQLHETDHADAFIPEIEAISAKLYEKKPLTLEEKIIKEAYAKLLDKDKAKPRTLSSLWNEYVEYRGIDGSTRGGRKALNYWARWISLAGDTTLGPLTLQHINDGMDAYVAARQEKVKSQSLIRELSDVASCFRLGSRKHRLGWHIELPLIKHSEPMARLPLEPSEQIALAKEIFNPQSSIAPKYGVALLLCLQGGMMVSEIERIAPGDIGLDSDLPHIKVANKTKRAARKRIIPIVLGVDLIREHLDSTILWLQQTTESAPSATLKKIIRRVTGNPTAVTHGLRHTFKINAQEAGVSVLSIASIAGWSDAERGVSKHLLRYGSEGISQSKIMRTLYDASLRVHEHLIPLQVATPSNVVAFKTRGPSSTQN
jgi:integrase